MRTTLLRQASVSRAWRQYEVIDRLRRIAVQRGLDGWAVAAVVKRCLSEWERGLRTVSVTYRDLFCELYASTADELGLTGEWTHNYPVVTRAEIAAGTIPTRLRRPVPLDPTPVLVELAEVA